MGVDVNYAKWMQRVPSAKKIQQLNIPGTHDTCTYKNKMDFVKTQNKSVAEQLTGGIRFLDARCRHIEDAFAMHHGSVYLDMMFGDVLNDCVAFLGKNPGECIIMSVKREYDDHNNKLTFDQVFQQKYYQPFASHWFVENRFPTLGEARGKMVLLRRYGGSQGIDASSWKDNATFDMQGVANPIHVQDQYVVPTVFDISKKWDHVEAALKAAKSGSSDWMYVNFTSGASSGAYPNAIAHGSSVNHGINRRLSDFLGKSENKKGRYGILPMDFVDDDNWECVKKLVESNL